MRDFQSSMVPIKLVAPMTDTCASRSLYLPSPPYFHPTNLVINPNRVLHAPDYEDFRHVPVYIPSPNPSRPT